MNLQRIKHINNILAVHFKYHYENVYIVMDKSSSSWYFVMESTFPPIGNIHFSNSTIIIRSWVADKLSDADWIEKAELFHEFIKLKNVL